MPFVAVVFVVDVTLVVVVMLVVDVIDVVDVMSVDGTTNSIVGSSAGASIAGAAVGTAGSADSPPPQAASATLPPRTIAMASARAGWERFMRNLLIDRVFSVRAPHETHKGRRVQIRWAGGKFSARWRTIARDDAQ
jgi:hypothetical protein